MSESKSLFFLHTVILMFCDAVPCHNQSDSAYITQLIHKLEPLCNLCSEKQVSVAVLMRSAKGCCYAFYVNLQVC